MENVIVVYGKLSGYAAGAALPQQRLSLSV